MFVPENLFSLIIPCYNESADTIEECLASVLVQQFFDFNCLETIIVSDGNHKLFAELENRLHKPLYAKLNLKVIELKENGGAGIARNAGIDATKGEYIIFADCDDVYHNTLAFADMYKAVTENHAYPDYLWGRFIEESHYSPNLNRPPQLVFHDDAMVWSFAKVIKRSLLKEFDINFLPDARIYEDTYFCAMCYAFASNVVFMDSALYFWRWHDNSTIRKNSQTQYYKHHKDIVAVNTALIEGIQKRLEEMSLPAEIAQKASDVMRNAKTNIFITCYTMEAEAAQLQPGLLDFVKKVNSEFVKKHIKWYDPVYNQLALGDALKQKFQNGIVINKGFECWLNDTLNA